MNWVLKSLLGINEALADAHQCEGDECLPNPLTTDNFLVVIDKIFNFLFLVSLAVAPVIIIVAGLQMLFAAGNEEKIRGARKTITYAVIGFVIVIVGKGIIFLLFELFTVEGPPTI